MKQRTSGYVHGSQGRNMPKSKAHSQNTLENSDLLTGLEHLVAVTPDADSRRLLRDPKPLRQAKLNRTSKHSQKLNRQP